MPIVKEFEYNCFMKIYAGTDNKGFMITKGEDIIADVYSERYAKKIAMLLNEDYEEMLLEVKDEMDGNDMWPDTTLESAAHMLEEGHIEPFKED